MSISSHAQINCQSLLLQIQFFRQFLSLPILFYLVSDLEAPVSTPVFFRKPDFPPHPHFPHILASKHFYLPTLSPKDRGFHFSLCQAYPVPGEQGIQKRGSPALSDSWKTLKEQDAHLRGSIDVQHQGFILGNHKPCLVPSFPTLLHVVQEAADDAVLSSH